MSKKNSPHRPRRQSLINVVVYLTIGICVGFAVLHPVSMLIDVENGGLHRSAREFLQLLLSRHHRMMSIYFSVLGGMIGIIQGLLANVLFKRNRRVSALEGLLPICVSCKRIREKDDEGGETWVDVERYIAGRSNAEFTHGICSDCMRTLYPEYEEKRKDPETQ